MDWSGGGSTASTRSGRSVTVQASAPFESSREGTEHHAGFRCADGTVCAFAAFFQAPK